MSFIAKFLRRINKLLRFISNNKYNQHLPELVQHRQHGRAIAYLICLILMAVISAFELLIVAPAVFQSTFWHSTHYALAFFLIYNINGNLIACITIDSSVNAARLANCGDVGVDNTQDSVIKWRYCELCECWVPPRAWHCNDCQVCILRRDHHCFFAGNCIGHANYRYFLMFLMHTTLATCYASLVNIYYLFYLNSMHYYNLFTFIKLSLPFILIYDYSWANLYLGIFALTLMVFTFSSIVWCFQLSWLAVGGMPNDRQRRYYNYGFKKNMEIIFGKRMHLIWLSAGIQSDLDHDGIHWQLSKRSKIKENLSNA